MRPIESVIPKIRVLAVDDNPGNLVALEAVLSGECSLTLAASGDEALALLRIKPDFDLILLDIQMPELDGYQTARAIKMIEGYDNVPIIFITAIYKEEEFIKKGYAVGGVDYFSKPFDPDILRMKVGIYGSFRQKANMLKERERQLHETEGLLRAGRRLANVLETLPVGVLISDTEGRICQTNGQVARICGELLSWWDPDGPLARALKKGESSHNDVLEIPAPGGGLKKILCSASPLMALDKHILGAVIVVQDITESRKIEQDLEDHITKFVSLGVELQADHLS